MTVDPRIAAEEYLEQHKIPHLLEVHACMRIIPLCEHSLIALPHRT